MTVTCKFLVEYRKPSLTPASRRQYSISSKKLLLMQCKTGRQSLSHSLRIDLSQHSLRGCQALPSTVPPVPFQSPLPFRPLQQKCLKGQ